MKKSITAESSQAGALDTSISTFAPFMTSARPSPVIEFTPVSGEAAMASWPCSLSLVTTLEPISPVPPMTTIFMVRLS